MSLLATVKFGKLAPKIDNRTLHLVNYMPAVLPPIPRMIRWTDKMTYISMHMNDKLGICTEATVVHLDQAWRQNVAAKDFVTDEEMLTAYKRVSGYDGTEATDNGACVLTVLKDWRKNGVGPSKIVAFAKIDPTDPHQVFAGITIFEGLYLGLALPKFINNVDPGTIWDIPEGAKDEDLEPGGLGGHAVPALNFDQDKGTIDNVTWGYVQPMSTRFFEKYTDEAYVLVSQRMLDEKGLNPLGIDIKGMMADMAAVTSL